MRILIPWAFLAALAGCGRSGPPHKPEQALQTFRIEEGFGIEVFAAEPAISDPVAMEFDENGRIYVVENHGYPLETESAVGRVMLLEDTNGDGRPDRSTVFADKLTMPTGVMRWKKGILVTDAPNVWYLEDTSGDGRADVKRAVLTGFAFTNPQHTVNGAVYGLDNWIYVAHEGFTTAIIFTEKFGDRGSDIRFADRSDGPSVKNERRNIRFRLDTYELEAMAGTSQFGLAFDEWGQLFTHNNSNHTRHEVVAARYLSRNPDLLAGSAMQDVSDHGSAAQVFPITERPRFEMLTNSWEFTSACGLTRYLGGAFGPVFERVSFIAEPAHNLVHRDVWSDAGSTFVAKRAAEGVEFLASTDSWFRPVNFYVGPDGALYLVDYYRKAIEHPEWMSQKAYESKDIYEGNNLGRIYRIVPESKTAPALPSKIRLGEAKDEELVRYLSHPNIWWRRTAQRLLVDRGSVGAVGPLERLAETGESPLGRLHALWTLEGLGKLDARLVEKALEDREAGVRRNAILLAEPRLSKSPGLVEKLLKLEGDPDPKVRFQLLCTLGYVDSAAARSVESRLLERDMEDRWVQVAALTSASGRALALFESAVGGMKTEGRMNFLRQVASVIGARQQAGEVRRVLQKVAAASDAASEWWRKASLEGLALGLQARRFRGRQDGKVEWKAGQDLLVKLFESRTPSVRHASLRLLEMAGLPPGEAAAGTVKRAAAAAENREADAELRADAIGLLALADGSTREALFKKLLEPREPEPVQTAAVRALGKVKGDEIGTFLIERWRAMTPAVRSEAADALFLEPGRVRLLLEAIEKQEVQAWTLQFRHKRQIIMHRDAAIRERGRPLLEETAGDRQKVVGRYQAALEKKGDAGRGWQVYERVCAKCHKMNGAGSEVGPDLATVRNRTLDALLNDILIPSQSIAQTYEAYVVETVSGGMIEGVIGPQTPTTITLRREEGKQDVIRRADIKSMYAANLSAMPEDLDKQVSVEQMADLLAFLKTAR